MYFSFWGTMYNKLIKTKELNDLSLACAEFKIDGSFVNKRVFLDESQLKGNYILSSLIKEKDKYIIPLMTTSTGMVDYINKIKKLVVLEFK